MHVHSSNTIDLNSPAMLDVQRGLILCAHADDEFFLEGYNMVFNAIPEFDEGAYLNVCARAGVSYDVMVKRIEDRQPAIHQRHSNLIADLG